jgi:hypothetical protein
MKSEHKGTLGRPAMALAALMFAMALLAAGRAQAAAFTVGSTADAVDAAPGDGLCATACNKEIAR